MMENVKPNRDDRLVDTATRDVTPGPQSINIWTPRQLSIRRLFNLKLVSLGQDIHDLKASFADMLLGSLD
jgi:hypothetical protein